MEDRLRAVWTRRAGAGLRGVAAAFALAVESRHLLYDLGVLAGRRAPIPIVSVGGLTVGGSGKTPIAADIVRRLIRAGRVPALIHGGFRDEAAVHRTLNPDALVLGHPSRETAVPAAAAHGADVAVLDDGFQHRRLRRDLEIVIVDADAIARTNGRRLPAGPFREGFWATSRADVLVVAHRAAASRGCARSLAGALRRRLPGVGVERCALVPAGLAPANAAAAERDRPDPRVAVAGIMKPRIFFRTVRERWPGIERLYSFRDHRSAGPEALASVARSAGSHGIVTTLKNAPDIGSRLPTVPVWYLRDRLLWQGGAETLRDLLARVPEAPGRPGVGSREGAERSGTAERPWRS